MVWAGWPCQSLGKWIGKPFAGTASDGREGRTMMRCGWSLVSVGREKPPPRSCYKKHTRDGGLDDATWPPVLLHWLDLDGGFRKVQRTMNTWILSSVLANCIFCFTSYLCSQLICRFLLQYNWKNGKIAEEWAAVPSHVCVRVSRHPMKHTYRPDLTNLKLRQDVHTHTLRLGRGAIVPPPQKVATLLTGAGTRSSARC